MFSMLGAFAEFERDLIRERVRAGIAHRRAKGLRVGRPANSGCVTVQRRGTCDH